MRVYLDNNRATMVDPQVVEAMEPFYGELYADRDAPHRGARDAKKQYSIAMEKIYTSIHAKQSDTIAITSGADESNSRLLNSIYLHTILTGKKHHIIISERESRATMSAIRYMSAQGCHVSVLPLNSDGIVDIGMLRDIITPKTALVSVAMVDAETGAIMPIDEIAQICQELKVPLHSDATHAIGKLPIDVQMLGLDFMTLSAETFHGVAGVGALYIKDGSQIEGLYRESQQTISTVGMGKALELSADAQAFEMEDVKELRDELEEALREIPDSLIISPWTHRVGNTVMVAFEGVESEMLLWELDQVGISAYMESGRSIIQSIGADESLKHSLVGFALSRYSTQEEIDYTKEQVTRCVAQIRQTITNTQEEIS